MRRLFRAVLACLAGVILAYLGCILFFAGFGERAFGLDRDGGKAMGFFFVIAPSLSLAAGLACAACTLLPRSRPVR